MRALLLEKMYELTKVPYQFFKKEKPWYINSKQLIQFPEETLGFHLGCFLLRFNFEIQEKLENHDVFHVVTNTGISVVEEIGMQYYLLGNGKKSPYLFMVILNGTLFYPNQFRYYLHQYDKGKKAHRFYNLDFKKMLHIPIRDIQETFNIT